MKHFNYSLPRAIGLVLISLALTATSYAAVYTATTSGSYGSSATWEGGVVPPLLVVTDQIVIPSGILVSLDNNVTINGAIAQLQVHGALNTLNNSNLYVALGLLSGAGTVNLNIISIDLGQVFSFTGQMTANILNSVTGFVSTAQLMVMQSLNLIGGTLSPTSGGSVDLGPGCTIVVTNGHLTLGNGGSIGLVGMYNVVYEGSSTLAGLELTGAGLYDVTVNVNSLNTITLVNDLTVQGRLWLNSGVLALGGKDLVLNGTISNVGNGRLASTNASNIAFNTLFNSPGGIMFNGTNSVVHNVTVNVGTGNRAPIMGMITIAGNLQLNSGTFEISDAQVNLTGTLSGNGNLWGNNASDLQVNMPGGTTTALAFESGGQMLRHLHISLGSGSALLLLSDIRLEGQLNLVGGSNLDMNGHAVTIGTAGSVIGSGQLLGNPLSNLTIDATGGITSLKVSGPLRNLRVNTGSTGSVSLGTDIVLEGALTTESGILALNGHDLTLNGDISTLGMGTISSGNGSDISVSMSDSPLGAIRFTPGSSTVNQLRVNVQNQGSLTIASDLTINNTLEFTAGKLDIGDNTLHMNIGTTVSGHNAESYVITGLGGGLERNVTAGGSTSVKFPIGTMAYYAPAEAHFNAGSAYGFVRINVSEGVPIYGLSGPDLALTQPAVNAKWNVNSTIVGVVGMNLQLMWDPGMEVNGFNRALVYISHSANGAWDMIPSVAATAEASNFYSVQRIGISSFSPFAVFDHTSVTPVEEAAPLVQFEIYPNPASESITVCNNAMPGEAVIMELYNSSGQLIGTRRLTDTAYTISLFGLEPGNYIMKFSTATMIVAHAIVKM